MAGSVVIGAASTTVEPGGTATCSVRVRNTGSVVDSFTISVLGDPAAWTTVIPPVLSLFPGDEGTVQLQFAPPRVPGLAAGELPFGVRVSASEDPDGTVVEEAALEVLPFRDVAAKITPRNSEAKRKARHQVVVTNKGNTPLEAVLSAADPDENLVFDLEPDRLIVPPGEAVPATVKVAAVDGFARGASRHRPFQVTVVAPPGDPAIILDATLIQQPGLPRFLVPLAAAVVAIALILAVVPNLGGEGSGLLRLTSQDKDTTTTTTAAEAAADEADEGEADAETPADEEAPAPTKEAGGGDKPAPDSGTKAAGGGDAPAEAGNDAPPPDDSPESPPATTPGAPPGSPETTTTTNTTTAPTTTVPSRNGSVRGTWSYDFDSGAETSNGADVFWQQKTETTRAFTPSNGAQFFNLGQIDYEKVDLAKLKSLRYSSAEIDGSDRSNQMPTGTVIAIKTNVGRYAKMRVERKEPYPANTLHFRFYTYPS